MAKANVYEMVKQQELLQNWKKGKAVDWREIRSI